MARLGLAAAVVLTGGAALAAAAAPAPASYVVEMTIEADGRAAGAPARLTAREDSAARFAMRRDAYAVEAIARPESKDQIYLHLAGTGWTPEGLHIESITKEIAADGSVHAVAFRAVDPATRRQTSYRAEIRVLPAA